MKIRKQKSSGPTMLPNPCVCPCLSLTGIAGWILLRGPRSTTDLTCIKCNSLFSSSETQSSLCVPHFILPSKASHMRPGVSPPYSFYYVSLCYLSFLLHGAVNSLLRILLDDVLKYKLLILSIYCFILYSFYH